MAVTTLDARTALILVDLQKGVVGLETGPHPAEQVVERAATLAAAFRERGLPVVLVNAAGGAPGRNESPPRSGGPVADDWIELVPELGRRPDDLIVTKRTWGAFHDTGLDALLRERGVTQVVIGGIATSFGVEGTARAAFEHGYNVTLAIDAMTGLGADAHWHSIELIFPRLGETGTTDQILELLKSH